MTSGWLGHQAHDVEAPPEFPHDGIDNRIPSADKGAVLEFLPSNDLTRICKMLDLNNESPLRATVAISAVLCGTAGCSGAPAHDILGSYFPSWMICVLLGLILALVTRQILVATRIDEALPAPVVVYLFIAVAFAFALWLLWLS